MLVWRSSISKVPARGEAAVNSFGRLRLRLASGWLLFGLIVLQAAPAAAHAVLLDASPSDNEQLRTPPKEVRLVFNEPVTLGNLYVRDATGARVDLDDAGHGEQPATVRVGLPDDLGDGAYIVDWLVLSADSHPVQGVYVFTIGDAVAPTGVVSDSSFPLWLVNLQRGFLYLAVLTAAGMTMFLRWVHDRRGDEMAYLITLVRRFAWAGIGLTLSGFGLFAWQRGFTLEGMRSAFTLSGLLGLGGLFLLVFGLRGLASTQGQRASTAALAGALLAAGSLAATGHTVTSSPLGLSIAATVVHLWAVAAWFGGLVPLSVSLRRRAQQVDFAAGKLVERFSRLATVFALMVLAAGMVISALELQRFDALWTTTYGRVLSAKLALVIVILLVALYNQRILLRRLQDDPHRAADALRRLSRTVRLEVVVLAGVLSVTSILAYTTPPRNLAGATETARLGPYVTDAMLGQTMHLLLRIDPAQVGENTVSVQIMSHVEPPGPLGESVQMHLAHADAGIGPIRTELEPIGPGNFRSTGREFVVDGTWQVTLRVRLSTFEEEVVQFDVPIRP